MGRGSDAWSHIHTHINIFMSMKLHQKCHLYDADIHTRINILMSIKLHWKCHLYYADIHTRINILMSIKLHWNYHPDDLDLWLNDLVINKHKGMRYVWFWCSHFIKPLDVLMWTILNWKCHAYDSYANTVMICTYVWYVLEVSSEFLSALCHI